MGEDFFEYLPLEIEVNILSRLPTRAAMVCKCVCKSWRVLLATPEFVNSHMARSVPGIAVETRPKSYEVFEFVDELGFSFVEEYHREDSFNFELPFDEPFHSSVNGLIFLRGVDHGDLILCNPVTRDYIKLPSHPQTISEDQIAVEKFGFGVSRTTGQYKVVRIFVEKTRKGYINECHVYTVGTGTWRKVTTGCPHRCFDYLGGLLFNGNLHWLVVEKIAGVWVERISCLDLETELFGTFSAPYPCDGKDYYPKTPCVLRDCLSLCNITNDFDIAIWSMKEYGDEKSWTKEVFNGESVKGDVVHACLVKVFENGDILMQFDRNTLFYYANETKTFYDYFTRDDLDEYISTILYAPSFLTLKNFVMENVSSF